MPLYESPYKPVSSFGTFESPYKNVYGTEKKPDINEFETLKQFAEDLGYEKKEGRSTFQKVSRLLNKDIAFLSGAVYGALDPRVSIGAGIQTGLDKNWGFADVVRNLGYNPTSRGGKIALGTGGFIADVLFSPLTYLTFGSATVAKIGGRAVTKKGLKFAQQATKESVESLSEKMIKEGIDEVEVHKITEVMAKKNVENLFKGAFTVEGGIKKLSTKQFDHLLNQGMSRGTLEDIAQLGPSLINKGGIRWMGHTLVTSKTLAKTPFGKAAIALGETKTVQALRDDFGELFRYGFKQSSRLMSSLDKGNILAKRTTHEVMEFGAKALSKSKDSKVSEFLDGTFQSRVKVVELSKKLEQEHFDELKKIYPKVKWGDKQKVISTFEKVKDSANKRTKKIQENIIKLGKNLESDDTKAIQATIKELRKELVKTKPLAKQLLPEVSTKEYEDAMDLAIGMKKETLTKTLDSLEKRIAKGVPEVAEEVVEKGVKVTKKGLDKVENIALLKRELDTIAESIVKGQKAVEGVLGARREAKKIMRDVKIDWKGDKQLEDLEELFFGGDNSIMAQTAKIAGVSEADTFDYYFSAVFMNQAKIKKFGNPSMSAGRADYMKEFGGSEAALEAMKKDPKGAILRSILAPRLNKIRHDTLKATLKSVGKPLDAFKDKALAKKYGYQKFDKEIPGLGKIEGWVPTEVMKNMEEFLMPRKSVINSLAKDIGFDYATGMFKSYVTTLFPGFYFRNMISNQFLLMNKIGLNYFNPEMQKSSMDIWLGASFPKQFGKNLDRVITTKTGVKKRLGDIVEDIKKESDIFDMGAWSNIEMFTEGVRKTGSFWGEKANPFSRHFAPFEGGKKFGTIIENQAKMTGIMSGILEGKTIKESIKIAEDAIFNYSHLTTFEKDIMRRVIPFYCVPDDTEILTKDGWKVRSQLSIGEIVLTYNVNKDINEWQPVKEIAVFDFDDKLVTMENKRGMKFRFTKDHRFPIETIKTTTKGKEYGGERKIIRAYDFNTTHKIPLAKQTDIPETTILNEKDAALLGWLVTDGYHRWRGKHFESMVYQSPKKYADEVRFEFADYISSESVHPDTGVICFRLKVKAMSNILKYFKSKDDMPSIVTRLDRDSLYAMSSAMMMAEGSECPYGGPSFSQKKGPVLDSFQIICQLLGIPFNFGKEREGCCAGTMRLTKHIYVKDTTIGEESYTGKIWCPKTENSTWVMRQNGQVIITGNTFARKNMEFQIKMLSQYPGRSAAQLKFIKGFGVSVGEPITGEDEAGLPSWMVDSLGIKAGTNQYGQSRFLTGLGLPIEEFIARFSGDKGFVWNTVSSTLQQINPLIKIPAERGIGVDFFRGRPITDLDNAGDWAALMDHMPDAVSKELKEFTSFQTKTSPIYVEGKKVGEKDVHSANPFFLHWLRNIPTSRLSATAGYLSDEEQTAFDKLLRVFTGVRGWSIDQERQKFYNELAEKEEIINYLDKMGVAGKKDIIYIRDNYKK